MKRKFNTLRRSGFTAFKPKADQEDRIIGVAKAWPKVPDKPHCIACVSCFNVTLEHEEPGAPWHCSVCGYHHAPSERFPQMD